MKRFQSNLEGLLRVRNAAEERAVRAVAVIERERQALEARLREQHATILMAQDAHGRSLVGRLDVRELRDGANAAIRAQRSAQQIAEGLAQVYQRLEASRGVLLEARTAKRALELLRDRRLAQWQRQRRCEEAALLDDMAAGRFIRSSMT